MGLKRLFLIAADKSTICFQKSELRNHSFQDSLGGLEESLRGVSEFLPVVDDGVRLRKLVPVDNQILIRFIFVVLTQYSF